MFGKDGNKKILERTDDEHILNASELCTILDQEYGISAERRTIDIEMEILDKFGLDVQQKKGKNPGYYIGARDFELPDQLCLFYHLSEGLKLHIRVNDNGSILFIKRD